MLTSQWVPWDPLVIGDWRWEKARGGGMTDRIRCKVIVIGQQLTRQQLQGGNLWSLPWEGPWAVPRGHCEKGKWLVILTFTYLKKLDPRGIETQWAQLSLSSELLSLREDTGPRAKSYPLWTAFYLKFLFRFLKNFRTAWVVILGVLSLQGQSRPGHHTAASPEWVRLACGPFSSTVQSFFCICRLHFTLLYSM